MPNRLIRDGILNSPRYLSVSDSAGRLFIHLCLLADDLGCVDLDYTFIRRRAFDDAPAEERVIDLLVELIDADLLRQYHVDARRYGFLPRFGQRLRILKLRHPHPPEALYADDPDASAKFGKLRIADERRKEAAEARRKESGN